MGYILLYNADWMLFNVSLALIPVIFGWLTIKVANVYIKAFCFLIWITFVPNTIYIVTDLLHIPIQWSTVSQIEKPVLVLQYLILEITGIICFILSMYFFERMLFIFRSRDGKFFENSIFFTMNYVISFGVVLGRIQRANSWEVFSDTEKIINSLFKVMSSYEMILLVIFFGSLGNIVYFLGRDALFWYFKKHLPSFF